MIKEKALRVWWIRNVPNKPTYYPVADIKEAIKRLNELADADLKNPLVESNVGGLQVYENKEWLDYEDEQGRSIDDIMEEEKR